MYTFDLLTFAEMEALLALPTRRPQPEEPAESDLPQRSSPGRARDS